MISTLELAKLCGVSQGTVDRALHNRPGISAATKEKILTMAKRYGYQPHPAARELIEKRSRVIATIAPLYKSVFFVDLLRYFQMECEKAKLEFFIAPYTCSDEWLKKVEMVYARRVYGAVLIPPQDFVALPRYLSKGLRWISLLSPCKNKNVVFVSPDERLIGLRVVEYLIQKGHQRILHVTYAKDYYGIRYRMKGYREGMQRHGLDPLVWRYREGDDWLKIIHKKKITALFCHNDWLALTMIRQIQTKGLAIPRDISVIGVDASDTFRELFPGLTSLVYPYQEVAISVVRLLLGVETPKVPDTFTIFEGNTVQEVDV